MCGGGGGDRGGGSGDLSFRKQNLACALRRGVRAT